MGSNTMAARPLLDRVVLPAATVSAQDDFSRHQTLELILTAPVRANRLLGDQPTRRLVIPVSALSLSTSIQQPSEQVPEQLSASFSLPSQRHYQTSPEAPLQRVEFQPGASDSGQLILDFSQPVIARLLASDQPDILRLVIEFSLTGPMSDKAVVIEWMKEAKKALLEQRDFEGAAELYQQVIGQTHAPDLQRADALEYLGLSYERLGQHVNALPAYRLFLQEYPDHKGADRVRQRLLNLETALGDQPEPRRQIANKADDEWELYGSLSQFFGRDEYRVSGESDSLVARSLSSHIDLQARHLGDDSNSRLRLSAADIRQPGSDKAAKQKLSRLQLEHHQDSAGWWLSAGRQTSRQDGTFGRYDGARFGYALTDSLEFGLVAGYPVVDSSEGLNTDRSFFGLSSSWQPDDLNIDWSVYLLDQQAGSLVDRRALGTEFYWYGERFKLLSTLDYDLFHQRLNLGYLMLDWQLTQAGRFHTSLDLHQQPAMTTTNAIIGQTGTALPETTLIETPEQLLDSYSKSEIYQLAKDRTALSQTVSLGWSQSLSAEMDWSIDLTRSETAATPASGGVAATPASGAQYSANNRISVLNWPSDRDVTLAGLRYSNTATVANQGLYANSRLQLGQYWRLTPKVSLDQRQWQQTDQTQLRLVPGIKLGYQGNYGLLEAETGLEWMQTRGTDVDETIQALFIGLGYQFDF
ncbi:MAG: tetratricopeptide repeat protein [Oceanobacter sp.]